MRFRREGSFADYLLFLHIQQVVQVRSAICVVPDQKRTAIDRVVVYGFFAFRTGTVNCVSYRYQPFGASLLCLGFTFPCQLVDAPAGGKLLALDIQGIS